MATTLHDTIPPPAYGRAALRAWLLRYVRGAPRPVVAWRLEGLAVERGWQRYAVHTALSELYRERKIHRVAAGCYRRKEVHLRVV